MEIKYKLILLQILVTFFFLFSNCAQVATGVIAKTATVSASDRTIGEFIDDTLIKTILKNTYFDQNEKIFFNVDVEVSQGRVLLTGNVEDINLRIEATRIAWGVDGVMTVINEIQINDTSNILNFADDLIINTKVAAKIMLADNINSLNYNIETVNKIVYVIGTANTVDERQNVINLSQEVYGVEEVVDYIIINTNKD